MDECELVALVTAVACAISKSCDDEDISLLAVVLTQLGDTLTTILTQRQINEGKESNTNDSNVVLPLIPPL